MAFSISTSYDLFNTLIPNEFIDTYLPVANPTFSIIYIYTFRHCFNKTSELEMKDIASALNILESDVLNAFRYFESINIVSISENPDNSLSIEFLKIPVKLKEKETEKETKPTIVKTKPNYSTQELNMYKSQSKEISTLFETSEKLLGKLLTYNDMNMLFGFYDWLRLPIDVIEALLSYCTTNGHKNMNYIEAVALDWSENNINTSEKAVEYTKRFNNEYREILKAFGQASRQPTQKEITFMKAWLDDYKSPLAIILDACDKAIMATGKPNFPYADGILKDWSTKNIKNLADISVAEKEFRAKKEETKKIATEKKPATKKTKFANYKGRTWDYEKLEKLEQEYINKKLDGV